jgi:hypothetical protein
MIGPFGMCDVRRLGVGVWEFSFCVKLNDKSGMSDFRKHVVGVRGISHLFLNAQLNDNLGTSDFRRTWCRC